MSAGSAISSRLYYARKNLWRRSRILFPSPAEMEFVRIMGGRTLTFKSIISKKNRFPFTYVLSMGRILRREYVQREYRIGAYYTDFAFVTSVSKKLIEIDGKHWHRDVVKELERDEYLELYGWEILHIPAVEIYRNPVGVRARVIEFLEK